jgi:hypothetical protein
MKEFDKFEEKNNECDCDHCRIARAKGWKAALEWALTQEADLNSTEIAYHIQKELEE